MSESKQEIDNSRGIPGAEFFDDIPAAVSKRGGDAEVLLKELHNLYGKYKFMESQLVQNKKGLVTKVPDIKNALSALKYLIAKKEKEESIDAQFEVADAIYAKAAIEPCDKVMLWLGANVMLEYDYEEAFALLTKNLGNAETNLAALEKDLCFLKDQITISEVNIARVHNYKVQMKNESAANSKAVKA